MTEDRRVTAARQWKIDGTYNGHIIDDLIAAYEERLRVNVGLLMENAELRKRAAAQGDQPQSVEQALAVLKDAGWLVRNDTGYGRLTATDPPLLEMAHHDPTCTDHVRTVAQERWKPATPR